MRRFLKLSSLSVAICSMFLAIDMASASCTVPNTLTSGQTADASQVMANFNTLASCVNTAVTPTGTPPQGRLTLTSNAPVMTADAVGQTTIYYTPYQGNRLPIASAMYQFAQLSFSLSTSAHLGGNLYDVFAYNASGTITLCTGPAWSSGTVRSAAISVTSGIWGNTSSLTCTLSGGGSTTSLAAGDATYLGTFYATANGQTGMAFQPTAAAGGTNNILGVWNAYNRVKIAAMSRDSTASWSMASQTWRGVNNSSSNRISYVDGLGQSAIAAETTHFSDGQYFSAGINRDATTGAPANTSQNGYGTIGGGGHTCRAVFNPSMGLHYLQAMEANSGSSANAYGAATGPVRQLQWLIAELEM